MCLYTEKPGIILKDILWGLLLVSCAFDFTFSVELWNIQQYTRTSTCETVGASIDTSSWIFIFSFAKWGDPGLWMGREAGPLVSGLGHKVSGCWPGMRPHKAFDLASIFHHALCCCPWYLSEHYATGSVSMGLALRAAFQPKGWIDADSSTLTFPDAVFSGFYCRTEQVGQCLRQSLFDLHKSASGET